MDIIHRGRHPKAQRGPTKSPRGHQSALGPWSPPLLHPLQGALGALCGLLGPYVGTRCAVGVREARFTLVLLACGQSRSELHYSSFQDNSALKAFKHSDIDGPKELEVCGVVVCTQSPHGVPRAPWSQTLWSPMESP